MCITLITLFCRQFVCLRDSSLVLSLTRALSCGEVVCLTTASSNSFAEILKMLFTFFELECVETKG